MLANSQFWGSSFVHCPYTWWFSQFPVSIGIQKCVIIKMWLGGVPHVVVRTLKISFDRHFFFQIRSLVEHDSSTPNCWHSTYGNFLQVWPGPYPNFWAGAGDEASGELVSSPDPTYKRGSGDIQLIPQASLTFWREISLRQSHCRKDNL